MTTLVLRPLRVAALALAVLTAGCATAQAPVDLARVRQEARIYVVPTGTAKFSVRNREREDVANTTGAYLGLIGLAVAIGTAHALDASDRANDIVVDPPMPRLQERLIAALGAEPALGGVQWVPANTAEHRSPVLTLELQRWGIESPKQDGSVYMPIVEVKATLVKGPDEMWSASCDSSLDRRSVLVDLRKDPEQLRTMMARATDACADDLVAAFLNRRSRDRSEEKKREVSFDGSRLSDVEAVLGTAEGNGLVAGQRRFEAEFEHLALTAADVTTIQRIVRDSMAAPRRSELKLRGTIDGQRFEAKMEKYASGRVRVKFDGLRFASEEDVDAFLAPFDDPIVRKLELVGEVAGRPLDRAREAKSD